ncbi:C-type mannose receptor 2 [Holothuria leucospilota]|uniref:C-type mannose receptor 2 n=1 Tax=Holothuria leucospilota TaxID=206669 RepID=A0A9Q1CL25_HOLLE|nr:C-type mannose receptor 2 [Holothuria leucospilota]
MKQNCSLMILNALITHAYFLGCFGLGVSGIGITEGHHVEAWTLSSSEPFVCTSIKRQATDQPFSIAVSDSFAIVESTSEKTRTSQETVAGAKGSQSTLQTTSENNVSPTTGKTSKMTSDVPIEHITTKEFIETTLQISVSSTFMEEKHLTSEISTQALETTTDGQTSSTPLITTPLTTEQIDETTTAEVLRQTTTITTTAALETSTDRQTSFTPSITTDPTTEQKTTTIALDTTTDRQTSSTSQITTNPTTEQKTTTVALDTTTDRQTSSTPHMTTEPTTEQKTTTIGLTTLAAANRVCHHSRPPYCYELIYEKKTYAEAYHSCRGLGAGSNLVSMVDADEDNDVKLLIVDESSEPTEDYWMGLGRTRYSWEDGKTLLYHNFDSGYVDGMCTVMSNGDYKWKSRACTSIEKTVCESDKGSQSCTVEFEGSCYDLLASSSTQATARTTCEASGGYVLQIESKEEQLFIQGQFSISQDIWIGLKSDGGNGFRWTDGASYGYDYFGSDYDNNYAVCFRIDYNDGFHWNDDKCDTLHNFICKWNL